MTIKTWSAGDEIIASDINNSFNGIRDVLFGDGSDGDITISVNTDLSRDMYYNNLTINTGIVLSTKGYRIFIKGTLTCTGTGKIEANGNAGGAGGTPTAGVAGVIAYSGGTLPIPLVGVAGGLGSDGVDASVGGNGVDQAKAIGNANAVTGARGSDSLTSNYLGGAAGSAGSKTGNIIAGLNSFMSAYNLFDLSGGTITQFGVAPSGSGGGGGAGQGGQNGGGGGGSGSSGGCVWIAAREIASLNVEAKGGAGGTGGDSAGGNAGIGGGGAGGNGGVIILIYTDGASISTDITGGAAGANGSSGLDLNTGVASAGNSGQVITIAT